MFTALARGALAAGHSWHGTILSLHERAIYILRGDGLAVSIVADEESMTAMSVLVPPLFDERPGRSLSARASFCSGSRLLVKDLAVIDLATCPAWAGRVASLRPLPGMKKAVRLVTQALGRYGKPGGLLGALTSIRGSETEAPHLSAARKALASGRLERLVGLGPGLTPAGDDFLAGALLAAAICGRNRPDLLPLDAEEIKAALPGTSPAGRTLLWMALQGRFPAFLVRFAGALTARSGADLSDAVRDACAHGESSGTDALAGFCWMAIRANPAGAFAPPTPSPSSAA
jgi:hypothetical protein